MRKIIIFLVIIVILTIPAKAFGEPYDLHAYGVAYKGWLQSWKDQNLTQYLSYYHPDFQSETSNMDFTQWKTHKTKIFNPRRPVQVELFNVTTNMTAKIFTVDAIQD